MLTWRIVVWAFGFIGETHTWVVARLGDAWSAAASVATGLAQAGLGIQVLVAVVYIAIGVWLALRAEPVGAPAVVWYDRVAIAVLWLPASAVMLGLWLAIMAYVAGAMVAFYAGTFGLVFLPYEAVIRGVLSLLER